MLKKEPKIKELKYKLTAFYNSDYKPLIKDTSLDYTHLNTVLDYLTIGIITMYENNIKLHYVEYIERYVNIERQFPEIHQRVSQSTIANYLGVSQEHLSRLKKSKNFYNIN
mgnify:CR=1 FL=1